MNPNQLSEKLLMAVKMGQPTDPFADQLASYPFDRFCEYFINDDRKKAFWINAYNAFFLILRLQKKLQKPTIYRARSINLAGQFLSLDDIEHGILRKYRFKWSLGYLPDPFAPKVTKKLAVATMDYRIHFALNCGARSCPPIAFYAPEKIESQLELATLSFLENETAVFPEKKEIHVTRLFLWFLGDFGGRRGIKKILKEKLKIKMNGHKLVFKAYDWEEELNNFVETGTDKK